MAFVKFLFVLCYVFVAVVACPINESSDQLVGGAKRLYGDSLKDAEKLLANSLAKISTGDCVYRVTDVKYATSQIVAGVLYEFNAQLNHCNELKTCQVSLLSQPWLHSGEITIDCAGDKILKKEFTTD